MNYSLKSSNELQLVLSRNLYTESVLYKCLYWYGDKYSCSATLEQDDFIVNVIALEEPFTDHSVSLFITCFKTNLLDYKTREIILAETKNIRELLIAKAFANHDDFDEVPPGEISDPVGFTIPGSA